MQNISLEIEVEDKIGLEKR